MVSVGEYSKFKPRKYGLLRIVSKINDNANVNDILGDWNIAKTFSLCLGEEINGEMERGGRINGGRERVSGLRIHSNPSNIEWIIRGKTLITFG